jgi:hypothetical protein
MSLASLGSGGVVAHSSSVSAGAEWLGNFHRDRVRCCLGTALLMTPSCAAYMALHPGPPRALRHVALQAPLRAAAPAYLSHKGKAHDVSCCLCAERQADARAV